MNHSKSYELSKDPTLTTDIAQRYAMLSESRQRLLKLVEGLDQLTLDFTPDPKVVESIGTLLLHIAAIEWSWIFEDIDGREMEYEKWKYAFAIREKIPQLTEKPLSYYLSILNEVRDEVYNRFKLFTDNDLNRKVGNQHKYSIDWIIYHLIDHESQHMGQISLLKRLYKFP